MSVYTFKLISLILSEYMISKIFLTKSAFSVDLTNRRTTYADPQYK